MEQVFTTGKRLADNSVGAPIMKSDRFLFLSTCLSYLPVDSFNHGTDSERRFIRRPCGNTAQFGCKWRRAWPCSFAQGLHQIYDSRFWRGLSAGCAPAQRISIQLINSIAVNAVDLVAFAHGIPRR